MVPLYGEGTESTMARLKREISALDLIVFNNGLRSRPGYLLLLQTMFTSQFSRRRVLVNGSPRTVIGRYGPRPMLQLCCGSTASVGASVTCDLDLLLIGTAGVGRTALEYVFDSEPAQTPGMPKSAAIDKISSTTASTATLAYFYCNAGDIEQHKAEAITASLKK
ncbi:hypothetical protein COCSADRAFT_23458 [Bipolaris sorokiniana ND90Pr]|nr:uncharacterized protein COCSADRAFT_23458 [Bipolaris sorokiniana ND90Pr]EMD67019.1 hypothetical protein COCSADRAFT_23458 [Bipolaris sorokiniana ND90Pr]